MLAIFFIPLVSLKCLAGATFASAQFVLGNQIILSTLNQGPMPQYCASGVPPNSAVLVTLHDAAGYMVGQPGFRTDALGNGCANMYGVRQDLTGVQYTETEFSTPGIYQAVFSYYVKKGGHWRLVKISEVVLTILN